MNTEKRINKQKELIETIGRQSEQEGMQPVAGRIMALLMVMDKEQFTFDEIVEELNISKSSASTALKILQLKDMVEYETHPGDRKRYFHIKVQEPFYLFERVKNSMIEKNKMMKSIIKLKADPESKNVLFFKDLIRITDLFLENYEKMKENFFKNQ
ncbi:MAG: MarR family transcriptional regulator [Candidatus Delongbacteria bacterium]|jgi:DNA-binding transcriptional regulator GbsR (MarR family)|nr:MarR family transcriptional regulator [Candidatus Delongbacteria bacterium]